MWSEKDGENIYRFFCIMDDNLFIVSMMIVSMMIASIIDIPKHTQKSLFSVLIKEIHFLFFSCEIFGQVRRQEVYLSM